jgi:beta-lactamase superfamily II metal-dependent hydrolase
MFLGGHKGQKPHSDTSTGAEAHLRAEGPQNRPADREREPTDLRLVFASPLALSFPEKHLALGEIMAFEVDFLAVGDGEKSGDAIAVRWGNLAGARAEQKVLIIDGGTLEAGKNLVTHVQNCYGTTFVDAVVCTHPDIDHACGLKVVLEELDFGFLLMHQPWNHASEVLDLFKNPLTPTKLKEKLQKSITAAHDLQEICDDKGKKVYEPFAGVTWDNIRVLGPNRDYYQQLLAQFRETPAAVYPVPSILQKAIASAKEKIEWVAERFDMQYESLDDSGVTSHENNSSAILLLTVDGQKLLFTADAGIPALTAAADYAASLNIRLDDLRFMQVPHHGSKHNVGKTLLNRIKAGTAYVSAGANAPKHPAKKVTNALLRRGATVCVTAGNGLCHYLGTSVRNGWFPAPTVPFYDQVEA